MVTIQRVVLDIRSVLVSTIIRHPIVVNMIPRLFSSCDYSSSSFVSNTPRSSVKTTRRKTKITFVLEVF